MSICGTIVLINLGNNYIDNYYYHQDLMNDNWRTNLILTYNQLKKDDDNLSSKLIIYLIMLN